MANERVAVLGASPKPERYSNMAVALLAENGHAVYPVTPRGGEINGLKCYKSLAEVPQPLDTVTLYLSPEISSAHAAEIIAAHPKRVIMNPGAENPELAEKCRAHGIQVVQSCTLVMLRTGQY
jgi:uncharacterized protein